MSKECGWLRRGDAELEEFRDPYIRVSLRTIIDCLPFVCRYFMYWIRHVRKRDYLYIDTFRPLCLKPIYGVSCGSLGSGAIGRTIDGGFCKFSLRPALVEQHVETITADQFIVNVRKDGRTVYQQVLSCAPNPSNTLSAWSFGFPKENLTYRGLYPRSWTTFQLPNLPLTLVSRQISPVFPHNYKDTSFPCSVFVWEVVNAGEEEYEVSITFTFRNGTGDVRWSGEGHCQSRPFQSEGMSGISLKHTIDDMPCTYSLAASKQNQAAHSITYAVFDPIGSGKYLWSQLLETGHLSQYVNESKGDKNEEAVALCVSMLCVPKAQQTCEFTLTWDMPNVHFGGRRRTYQRRYTRWFGNEGSAGQALCEYALSNYKMWEEKIESWQNPVLDNECLPWWYKSALFNELYFMTDGGSVWFEYSADWKETEPHLSDYTIHTFKEVGRFGYLESWEYRMINTYDVHFYASVALSMLWPKLEETIQSEFSDQVFAENTEITKYFYDGERAKIKAINSVPHDLGNPADDPWLKTNCYRMHNTDTWRDLNLKFILMSYRDLLHVVDPTKRKLFLDSVWPKVQALIAVGLESWDVDGDGMIENSGTCDQTYDCWRMKGTSAYCGSLWLASLYAASQMAKQIPDPKKCQELEISLQTAKDAYEKKLWTGTYYKFDEFSRGNDSVMSDQLCGHWFLIQCEGEKGLSPEGRVQTALATIFRSNVMGFGGGGMGAVNGMKGDGGRDRVCIQSEEVWTGVTYALASFMIHKGLIKEGFHTARGLYNSIFNRFGLHYQTPEALYEKRNFRAVGYMRPLAIWSIQWVLEKTHNFPHLSKELFAPIMKDESHQS